MHADFNELSEVAAGRRPSSAHVAACTECLGELARVRAIRAGLAGLPAVEAPAGAWAGALARAAARRQGSPARAATPASLAMAASLVAMLAAGIILARAPSDLPLAEQPVPLAQPIDGLVAENTRLEAMLAGMPQSRTARVGTAYTVAAIEDRLALLDDRITVVSLEPHAPEAEEALWRERVNLMNSLVQVQYANLMASR